MYPEYVMRPEIPAKIALTWTLEGKLKKGRPRTTWRRMMEDELNSTSLTLNTALKLHRTGEHGKSFLKPHVPLGMTGFSKLEDEFSQRPTGTTLTDSPPQALVATIYKI
jgi:hypothetical protein